MRVYVHPADAGGCGMYRLVWPSEQLIADGHDVHVLPDHTYKCEWLDTIAGPTVKRVVTPIDADVVVIQRPLHRNRYELIRAIQARGCAVVVEIDDDFHAISLRNPAWRAANPMNDRDVHRDWLARSCEIADLVTVSTPALAKRYGGHGRVVVLDNYVRDRYVRTEPSAYTREHLGPRDPRTTVGWTGTVLTHPGDLEQTGGGVAKAVDETGACLSVVGTGIKVRESLGYDGQVAATGWVPIEAYPECIRRFDVGIVPLKPTEFNEAKSHLKGLEFASLGVPFVATPTGPYRRLADAGIGWPADTPADWWYLTRELILDHEHRRALAAAWRDEVEARWTIEGNAWRWAEAWERALAHQRERVAA